MSKKLFSLLLAAVLTASMITIAAVSVSAEAEEDPVGDLASEIEDGSDDTCRYYFYMPSDWYNEFTSTAGIYWWSGTTYPSAWPGYQANATDTANIYYYDVPSNCPTIIWNNFVDGGEDTSTTIYSKAVQTIDIAVQAYYEGDSDTYPDGLATMDNMIYVIDSDLITEDSGKCIGEWYYYYGNGEYGTLPTREEAVAADALYTTEYHSIYGEEETTDSSSTQAVETTSNDGETEPTDSEVTTDAEETTSAPEQSDMYLRVNATSNYFPAAMAEYNEETKEVTVTYSFKASKDLLNCQWYLTYDSSVLKLSDKNTTESVMPFAEDGALVNLTSDGIIRGAASNISLYDVSDKVAFVEVVFDVLDLDEIAPVNTTVDLNVEVLLVSAKQGDETYADPQSDVTLVDNSNKQSTDDANSVAVNLETTLTESTYIAPTSYVPTTVEPTEETTDVVDTTAAEDTTSAEETTVSDVTDSTYVTDDTTAAVEDTTVAEETTEATTAAEEETTLAENTTVADATSSSDNSDNGTSTVDTANSTSTNDSASSDSAISTSDASSTGAVQTGDTSFAVITLLLLVAATGVMFVIRKREMY